MKYVANYSGGKDSQAMCLKLMELEWPLDEIIHYANGVDFDCVKNNVKKMQKLCRKKGITFTIIEPAEIEAPVIEGGYEKVKIEGKDVFLYYMLQKPVTKKTGECQMGYKWCNGCCRWGTALKLDAIKEHYKTYGNEPIVEYVGIAADERDRINRKRNGNRVKVYPLVEWNMTEKDCLEYCYSKGWHWSEEGYELYDLLDRVSCKYCGNKNLKELRNIYHYLPKLWKELKDLQDKINMPYRAGQTIHQIETRFILEDAQLNLFEYDEEFRKSS